VADDDTDFRGLAWAVQRVVRRYGYRLCPTAGRGCTIFSDDALVVSYPRSGNTWLIFLLTNLLYRDSPTTFANIEERCPDIYLHSDDALRMFDRPRLLKSHEYLDPRYPKVLYLVRNPLDVCISYMQFLMKMRALAGDTTIVSFVDKFLSGALDSFGTWDDHVGGWIGARGNAASFYLLRYEDLRKSPAKCLAAAADFLGLSPTADDCERAVREASIDRMQRMEKEQTKNVPELRESRKDIPFIGDGIVDRGRHELPADQQQQILARYGNRMRELGYG
jgi:hypothetical protein